MLSHHSAAALWQLAPRLRHDGRVEVSTRGGQRVRGSAVRVHRVNGLDADETTVLDGIPITTVARTIVDLAGTASEAELEQMVARAEREGMTDREQLTRLIARRQRRPGMRTLSEVLSREGGPALTRSEAESRLLALVRKGGLPAPGVNVTIRGYEVDFLWRTEHLVVEVDGAAFHSSSRAFESDRRRDSVLAAGGFRVIRVTWRQLVREPEALLVRLAQALVANPVR